MTADPRGWDLDQLDAECVGADQVAAEERARSLRRLESEWGPRIVELDQRRGRRRRLQLPWDAVPGGRPQWERERAEAAAAAASASPTWPPRQLMTSALAREVRQLYVAGVVSRREARRLLGMPTRWWLGGR